MAITFDTVFKIGAVFTGAAAMAQAQAAVTKLEERGLLAGFNLKKMVVGLGGLAAGYLTVDKLTGFINNSITAARSAKAAYEGIGTALGKVPQMQKLGTIAIEDQKKKLMELAKTMERTGVIAAESLGTGFGHLIDAGMAPAKIAKISGAFQDLIVRTKGVKASIEEVAGVSDELGQAIYKGGQEGAQALTNLGLITEDQQQKFISLKTYGDRYNFTLGEMQKHVGDTATAMKTWDGVQQRFHNAWKNITLAIGTPFMQAQDKVTAKLQEVQEKIIANADRISQVITPIVEKYSDKVGDFLIKIVDNIDKAGPSLEKFGKIVNVAFDFILKHGKGLAEFSGGVTVFLGAFGGATTAATGVIKITGAIKGLSEAWGIVSKINFGAIMGLMTPQGLIIAAIALLAVGIYELVIHWKEVSEWAGKAWDSVKESWGNASNWFDEHVANGINKSGHELWDNISKSFVESWENTKNQFMSIVNWIDVNIIQKIIGLWNALPADLQKAISTVFDILIAPFKQVWDWVSEHNPVKLLTPNLDVSKEVQSSREATLNAGQLSDSNRLMAARAEDEKLGPTHHEHFQALQKVIEAEHLAQKQQVQNTKALTDSTGALYGHSPGFIPGVRDATASLYKFEASISQAQGSMAASMGGGMSLGAGGMSAASGGMSLGAGGVASSAGGIQVTHYGYEKKGDKDWDSNSAAGIGAYNNKLSAGFDVALNRKSAAMLGLDYNRDLGKVFNYQGRQWRYGDRTAEWLPNPRFDVYDPGGNLVKGARGGLVSHPSLALLGERIPEMTIPLEGSSHSRSLLSSAAQRIGMGSALGGGDGPVNLHMNAPITINGVQAGQEGAIAREVQKAMQDPIRQLLDQLKKAKLHEQRLSYA
jgi:hypothetical protein